MENYKQLLQATVLPDQTYLVDSMLKEASEIQHFCQLYNHLTFNIALAEETFTGNLSDLEQKIAELKAQLVSVEKQIAADETLADTTLYKLMIQRLQSDINLLNSAEGQKREIFQWLLVPYWLSEKLIMEGQVVLRVYGNNWWGITSLSNQQHVLDKAQESLLNRCQCSYSH